MASLPSWAQLTEPSALSCLYSVKRCLPSAITPALPVFLQERNEQLTVDLKPRVNAAMEAFGECEHRSSRKFEAAAKTI